MQTDLAADLGRTHIPGHLQPDTPSSDAVHPRVLQVQAINKFVNNRNLPPELCEDISRHVETSQVMHQEQGDADVFSTLSHTLQVGCKLCLVPCLWQLLSVDLRLAHSCTVRWHSQA